jgi:hypothetical protein
MRPQHRAPILRTAPARRGTENPMDAVAIVMLGSVALWMFQQFERHE